MAWKKHQSQWHAVGGSVRGASHWRAGLPNQDAIRWTPRSGQGPPLIVAVADGHGSASCFRSHIGARLAVKAAALEIQCFLNGLPDPHDRPAFKRRVEDELPRALVRRWHLEVAAHLRKKPFSPEDLEALSKKGETPARQAVIADLSLAYGATILATLVAESFILYLQLGDGDILNVSEGGTVTRPLPGDERSFGNETTSLCTQEAWRYFRVAGVAYPDPLPELILLATDGYANSFLDEEGFLQVGRDIWNMIRADGLDRVSAELESWLNEASRDGSGDDISVGILSRRRRLAHG